MPKNSKALDVVAYYKDLLLRIEKDNKNGKGYVPRNNSEQDLLELSEAIGVVSQKTPDYVGQTIRYELTQIGYGAINKP